MADNTQAPRCRVSRSGLSARKPVGQLAANRALQHVLASTPPVLFTVAKKNKVITFCLFWENTCVCEHVGACVSAAPK